MQRRYFSLVQENNIATLNIYGDITSWAWEDNSWGDMSAILLSKQLDALGDVNEIHVFINSYGGEVSEGLAIYNSLRRHKAKITTYCDGFACSIASVIFMAGDERIMNSSSLLMIHNAWTWASGNSAELRKQADDLEKITQASVEAYKEHSSLSEEEIKALMDAETWILPSEALEYGFATAIQSSKTDKTSQSAFKQLMDIVKAHQKAKSEEEDEDETEDETTENDDQTTKDDDEETENETQKEEATQRMSCFFSAILKM